MSSQTDFQNWVKQLKQQGQDTSQLEQWWQSVPDRNRNQAMLGWLQSAGNDVNRALQIGQAVNWENLSDEERLQYWSGFQKSDNPIQDVLNRNQYTQDPYKFPGPVGMTTNMSTAQLGPTFTSTGPIGVPSQDLRSANVSGIIGQIDTYLKSLSPWNQIKAYRQIQDWSKGHTGEYTQSDLQDIFNKMQGSFGQADQSNSAPTTAQTQNQTEEKQSSVPNDVPGLANDPSNPSIDPNTGLPSAISQYEHSQGDVWGQLSTVQQYAARVGMDPNTLQQEYNSYLNSPVVKTNSSNPSYSPMSLEQYALLKDQAVNGAWAPVIGFYEQMFEQQRNSPMPLDLHDQLLGALNNLSPEQQYNVHRAMAQYNQELQTYTSNRQKYEQSRGAQAWVKAHPGSDASNDPANPDGTVAANSVGAGTRNSLNAILGGIVGTPPTSATPTQSQQSATTSGALPATVGYVYSNYLSNNPDENQAQASIQNQAVNAVQSLYAQYWGTTPPKDILDQAKTKSLTDLDTGNPSSWINTLPFKMGMTLGQYNDGQKRLQSYSVSGYGGWQQIFGHQPTEKEVYQASSMNDAQLNDWINNSSSNISGMNIGTYVTNKTQLDKLSQNLFGTPATDELVKDFGMKG